MDAFDTGFTVRTASWHGKENLIMEYPGSFEEALVLAGRTWEPVESPVLIPATDGSPIVVPNYKAILRSDNSHLLSVMPKSYEVIPPKVEGELIETLLGQTNVKFDTMGSLNNGRQVYTTVYLDEPTTIPGDFSPTYPYLSILNSYDGSTALKAAHNNVRIVCWNTFNMSAMAGGSRAGTEFTFRHTKNWRNRVDQAKEALFGAREENQRYIELASELAGINITDEQRERFVVDFIPSPPETLISDRVARNIEEARAAVRAIFNSRSIAPIQGNAYGLLQAAGEYLDHVRPYRSQDTYTRRTLLSHEPLKARALGIIKEVVQAS